MSRHRPAPGFCERWRAGAAPGRARTATGGTFQHCAACCCCRRPTQWPRRGDAGSSTRCFAAPNLQTTDLAKPILTVCVLSYCPSPRLSAHMAAPRDRAAPSCLSRDLPVSLSAAGRECGPGGFASRVSVFLRTDLFFVKIIKTGHCDLEDFQSQRARRRGATSTKLRPPTSAG